MTKKELTDFLTWIINSTYVIKQSTVEDLADEYLKSAKSEPQNESPNIRQNEEQVRNCETCVYSKVSALRHPCNICRKCEMWEAITIVPTEGHSA